MKPTQDKSKMSRIQLHRLARIAALLQKNAHPTPQSLLREYYNLEHIDGVTKRDKYSLRTVFRDIDTLKNDFKCPLAYDRSVPGYYLKHHGWDFNCPTDLSESAMLALVVGAKIAEDVFPNPLRERVKVAVDEILKGNNPDFLDTTLMNSLIVFAESSSVDISHIFPVVFDAWQLHRSLRITYDQQNGKPISERVIDPHVLFLFEKEWRIKAYCHLKDGPRTFVISRILKIEMLDSTFEPDMKIIASVTRDKVVSYPKIPDVRIRLTGTAKKFAMPTLMHSEQKIELEPDGKSWLFTIPEVPSEVVVPWILSQGGDAVPLSPQCIVDAVREKTEALLVKIK
ncbi:MAG: WYL domain-containing protein [Victivallaceae bacterium]|nr:WYL domain-containing protein [Victivallaceae bacterium]